jgi:mRNA-degrading endonuclease RelE of RelBE toxin-antitoxin system/antitoxin (DNA-binding transcriptional repressor) of toxin-antitoxin stability system
VISKGRTEKKLRVSDEIAEFIKGCHPKLKRKIRAGLSQIATEPKAGKSLKDELTGLKSYRISRLRIIYRVSSKQAIDIVAIGPRKTIYEETYRLIKKEPAKKGEDVLIPETGKTIARIIQEETERAFWWEGLRPLMAKGLVRPPSRRIDRDFPTPLEVPGKPVSEMVIEDRG